MMKWLRTSTYRLTQWFVRITSWLLFRMRSTGQAEIPTQGGALLCANHQSFFDPVLIGSFCPRSMNYVARETLFEVPVLRGLMHWYNAIPIQRDGIGIGGIKETLKRLKKQEMVLIFPEGTRTTNGDVGKIKSGFCALARRGKVPIVPVGLDGAYHAWPKDQKYPWFARMAVCYGNPISVETIASLDDDQLVDLLQQRIVECFQKARSMSGR